MRFLANRALRIFPAYWVVLAISVTLLYLSPNYFGNTYSTMRLPETAWSWVQNVFLLDLSTSASVISPPAWTLTVEFFFYIAMPLLLARTKTKALIWLALSLGYTVYLIGISAPFSARYSPVAAASLFFAVGSNLYMFRVSWAPPILISLAIVPVFVIFPLLVEWAGGDRLMLGFYGSVALGVPILLSLLHLRSSAFQRIDTFAGDLAYPIFLSHVMAGGVVRIFAPNLPPSNFSFLIIMLLVSFLWSTAWLWVEYKVIAPRRDTVRGFVERTGKT